MCRTFLMYSLLFTLTSIIWQKLARVYICENIRIWQLSNFLCFYFSSITKNLFHCQYHYFINCLYRRARFLIAKQPKTELFSKWSIELLFQQLIIALLCYSMHFLLLKNRICQEPFKYGSTKNNKTEKFLKIVIVVK